MHNGYAFGVFYCALVYACVLFEGQVVFFYRWQSVRRCMYFSCFHQGQKMQILLPHFLWEQLTFYFRSRNLRKIILVREARISSQLYDLLVYYFFIHFLPFTSRLVIILL